MHCPMLWSGAATDCVTCVLRADCLQTGISSGPYSRLEYWTAFILVHVYLCCYSLLYNLTMTVAYVLSAILGRSLKDLWRHNSPKI